MAAAVLAPLAACSGGFTPTPSPAGTPGLGPPQSFEGYTLFSPASENYAYLIDHQGQVVHTYLSGIRLARLLDNGNVLSTGNKETDREGNVVWRYRHPQHHDLLKLPNGNVLFLSSEDIGRAEAAALGANPGALSCLRVSGARVVEARPTGPASAEIVWKWSVFDHLVQDFDPEKPNYGDPSDRPVRVNLNYALAEAPCLRGAADWTHANALDYNAALDQIMVTVRNFSEIWVIDRSPTTEEAAGSSGGNAGKGGDLLYRWGNPRAYGAGTPADQRLFWPHAGGWIPEDSPGAGNVLVFNNGNEYPGFERFHSSADEVALPYDGYNYRRGAGGAYGPDEAVWTYAADPPGSFYSSRRSNAQRLPNGNTLITDGPAGRIFEVAPEGETAWSYRAPNAEGLYRAYRYSPDHPGLRGLDLTPHRTTRLDALAREPLARSTFDLYTADGYFVYVKEQCGQGDLEHRFFLHIVPERTGDLPEERRQVGFDNLDFDFFLRGALFDGKCAARIPLPDYPVSAVRTGQFGPAGELWSAEAALEDGSPLR